MIDTEVFSKLAEGHLNSNDATLQAESCLRLADCHAVRIPEYCTRIAYAHAPACKRDMQTTPSALRKQSLARTNARRKKQNHKILRADLRPECVCSNKTLLA